jgi:DNA-binding NtrC family response regulator
MPESQPLLLSIVEIGGYPDFTALYQKLGFQVEKHTNMRKVLQFLKKSTPQVIVAEFNFQSDFRDRTSSLESMMAVVQRMPGTRVVVLYDKEKANQLARLTERFPLTTLAFPITEVALQQVIAQEKYHHESH